jgi:hypothetical protein
MHRMHIAHTGRNFLQKPKQRSSPGRKSSPVQRLTHIFMQQAPASSATDSQVATPLPSVETSATASTTYAEPESPLPEAAYNTTTADSGNASAHTHEAASTRPVRCLPARNRRPSIYIREEPDEPQKPRAGPTKKKLPVKRFIRKTPVRPPIPITNDMLMMQESMLGQDAEFTPTEMIVEVCTTSSAASTADENATEETAQSCEPEDAQVNNSGNHTNATQVNTAQNAAKRASNVTSKRQFKTRKSPFSSQRLPVRHRKTPNVPGSRAVALARDWRSRQDAFVSSKAKSGAITGRDDEPEVESFSEITCQGCMRGDREEEMIREHMRPAETSFC